MANMYMGDQALGTVSVVLNTADATATAADILKDKTAYVGDKKVVGTHECEPAENLDSELATQDAKIAELQAVLAGKASVASEDLSDEMTAQDEAIASQDGLIAQIATALEGKCGASCNHPVTEACTITINFELGAGDNITTLYYTSVDENGYAQMATAILEDYGAIASFTCAVNSVLCVKCAVNTADLIIHGDAISENENCMYYSRMGFVFVNGDMEINVSI